MWHLIAVAKRQYRVRRAINETNPEMDTSEYTKKMLRGPELDSKPISSMEDKCKGRSVLKCDEKKKMAGGVGRNGKITGGPGLGRWSRTISRKREQKRSQTRIGTVTTIGL